MRTALSFVLQLWGMALPAIGLYHGLTHEHGMGLEMTLLIAGVVLFLAGRLILPSGSAPD